MSIIVPLILALVILLDLQNLRLLNNRLFNQAFFFSRQKIILIITAVILIFLFVPGVQEENHPGRFLYILLLLIPIYFLRRQRFKLNFSGTAVGRDVLDLVSDANGVVLGWFFSVLLTGAILHLSAKLFPQIFTEFNQILISVVVTSLAALSLIHHASVKFSPNGFWVNVGFLKNRGSKIKTIGIPIALGMIFAFFSAQIETSREIQPQTPLAEILQTVQSPIGVILFLSLAVLFAPLVEEIIFRGYFFHVLARLKGVRFAVVFIGLVFGALHYGQYWGDWIAIVMVTVLGLTLTFLRAWTGTTLASTIMHYSYNLVVIIITAVMNASEYVA